MTVQEAANQLLLELNQPPWLVAVGIGKKDGVDCIYVYTKRTPKPQDIAFLNNGWEGFPVIVKKTGQFSPLTA